MGIDMTRKMLETYYRGLTTEQLNNIYTNAEELSIIYGQEGDTDRYFEVSEVMLVASHVLQERVGVDVE